MRQNASQAMFQRAVGISENWRRPPEEEKQKRPS